MGTELIPGLPEDISLQCLLRLPISSHRTVRRVAHRWRHLIDSPDFHRERRRTRNTSPLACFIQALPKPTSLFSYSITVFDPLSNKWSLLSPPPFPLPLFCQLAAAGGQLAVLGGWDPNTWDLIRAVWVYNFATGMWHRGRDMPVARSSFAAAGDNDDRIYVAGGHDEARNVLASAAWYDVRRDEWGEVAAMPEERDECEGLMIEGEFWVVSGLGAEGTGRFLGSAEVYEVRTGRWRKEEGVWPAVRKPRGSAGVGGNGRLVCWAEEVTEVRVGMCGVRIGEKVMVLGMASAFPEAPAEFYVLTSGGEGGMERVDPPAEFSCAIWMLCRNLSSISGLQFYSYLNVYNF